MYINNKGNKDIPDIQVINATLTPNKDNIVPIK